MKFEGKHIHSNNREQYTVSHQNYKNSQVINSLAQGFVLVNCFIKNVDDVMFGCESGIVHDFSVLWVLQSRSKYGKSTQNLYLNYRILP